MNYPSEPVRAIRRAGELLKQLDGRGDHRKTEGDHGSSITQREAARSAGLSAHQQLQAVRVASVSQATENFAVANTERILFSIPLPRL